MNNLHLIEVTYLGPTNTKGARVKLYSHRFAQSVTIAYDYAARGICEMADAWLRERGFVVVGVAEMKKGYALLSDTFEPLKGE